jgi:hypothetical protein
MGKHKNKRENATLPNRLSHLVSIFLLPAFFSSCATPIDSTYDMSDKSSNGELEQVGNNGIPAENFPLGVCEGDCDNDGECAAGLLCFQRSGTESVPGCSGSGVSAKDYCYDPNDIEGDLVMAGDNGSPGSAFPLGRCEGDCDNAGQCAAGLLCFQRNGTESVPGCSGSGVSAKDYCYDPNDIEGDLVMAGDNDSPGSAFPLGRCEGDCDNDGQCAAGLLCFQRSGTESVPGCSGAGQSAKDYCYDPSDDNDQEENDNNRDVNDNNSGNITHIGTTEVWDSNGQDISIDRPSGSRAGDLLILVLHRTDDDLPLYVDGWTRVAECFKKDNGHDCSTEDDCTSWHDDDFCGSFGGHGGHDLAQSIFYRRVGSSEPSSYVFDLNRDSSGHPGWIILTALRGADTNNPVRDWSYKGCDGSSDSVFPSVDVQEGDMILLSQSFDDAVSQSKFGAPDHTETFGYVSNSDEAGFLFGGIANSNGPTGTMKTRGDGASSCKDALVSLSIRPQ